MVNVEKMNNIVVFQREAFVKKKKISSLSPTSTSNKNFESSGTYALQISRRFLMMLGIWQSEEAEKFSWRLVLTNVSIFICYFTLAIVVIPMGLHIFMESMDPIGRIKLTGPWSFCLMATLKYFFLRSHRYQIDKCIRHVELDWSTIETSRDKNTMIEYARYGHLVTITCAIFSYSGGTFFALLPFVISKLTFAGDNDNNNCTIVKQLSLPSTFVIFVVTESPIYEIVYVIQIIASFIMHSIAVTCYSLAVVVVMHSCGQLKILMKNIDQLLDENSGKSTSENIDRKISDIIKRHVRALRFISSAERMLREICLVELGGGTSILCFSGFLILLEWGSDVNDPITLITFAILFSSFAFNIFSFCYVGQLLTNECEKVGETTYMIDWYRLQDKKSLDLCVIIALTQKPVTLTAGGAIQLSYKCFATVVRTSLGYLNVLRAVMD